MATRAELLRLAWETGNLEFLVKPYQLPIYQALWAAINNPDCLKYVLDVARRFGKTHVASIVAVEFAIRNPKSQINYACVTDKAMKKILRGIMPVIFETCPLDLQPKLAGGTWEFKNGSVIYTAGVNNQHADDLRGTSSHLNIVDEAAQIDELKYLVQSVLMPQQLTVNGTMLLLSTPPTVSDHDYAEVYRECVEAGHVKTFTIYDNEDVMSDPQKLAAYIKEAGGEHSVTWQREYLAKWVTDKEKPVIPEWDDKFVVASPQPVAYSYLQKYVGADFGFNDKTCFIFGHYDFARAKLVIEDEFVVAGEEVTTKRLASEARAAEARLGWSGKNVTRIGDNSHPVTLNDLHVQEKYTVHPTTKDELHAMVNQARLWIGAGRLEVHPRCEYLIACLKHGIWDKNRKEFARSKKLGHYDGLAALIYLLRYVDEASNPIPATLNHSSQDLLLPVEQPQAANHAALSRALSLNRGPTRRAL